MHILTLIRRYPQRAVVATVISFVVIGVVFALFQPRTPAYVTALVERGDLVQTVEEVGTVISDDEIDLLFTREGIVADVFVKEGDTVEAGAVLATLRSDSIQAEIDARRAKLAIANADLRALLEGARPEDVAVTEAEVANLKADLNTAKTKAATAKRNVDSIEEKIASLKREADVSIEGLVAKAETTIDKYIATMRSSITTVADIFRKSDVRSVIRFYSYSTFEVYDRSREELLVDIDALDDQPLPTTRAGATALLQQTRVLVSRSADLLQQYYDLMDSFPETGYLSLSELDTEKSSIAEERDTVRSASNTLDIEAKALQDSDANFATRLAAEEVSLASAVASHEEAMIAIQKYEALVETGRASLRLKTAAPRETDVIAAKARVREAQANVDRALSDYDDHVIKAPMAGTITAVSVQSGERTHGDAAVTLLGTTPYRMEVFISDIDIPFVSVGQEASVVLDAFLESDEELTVQEIDPAGTERDGSIRYRVRLDFEEPRDDVRVGMTGDMTIVTNEIQDVLFVPGRSVIEDNGASVVRVLTERGQVELRLVETGLRTDTNTEILSGVKEGETVIVLIPES